MFHMVTRGEPLPYSQWCTWLNGDYTLRITCGWLNWTRTCVRTPMPTIHCRMWRTGSTLNTSRIHTIVPPPRFPKPLWTSNPLNHHVTPLLICFKHPWEFNPSCKSYPLCSVSYNNSCYMSSCVVPGGGIPSLSSAPSLDTLIILPIAVHATWFSPTAHSLPPMLLNFRSVPAGAFSSQLHVRHVNCHWYGLPSWIPSRSPSHVGCQLDRSTTSVYNQGLSQLGHQLWLTDLRQT